MQEQWEIGLAPRAGQSLLRHLRQLGHHEQTLVEAGLAKRSDNGDFFDLFRDRVVFPLRSQDGEVVGFIGRRRDDAPGPKYLNTPETEVFHKGEVLFGLHEARAQLARNARPLLVEGPLDAIAVNATLQETYAAIAPCGTAITTSHIETIAAHTDLATSGLAIALDGDPAGRAGVIRAWRTLRNITGPVDVAVLPQGQDPAELLSITRHSSVRESLLSVTPLADLPAASHLDEPTLDFLRQAQDLLLTTTRTLTRALEPTGRPSAIDAAEAWRRAHLHLPRRGDEPVLIHVDEFEDAYQAIPVLVDIPEPPPIPTLETATTLVIDKATGIVTRWPLLPLDVLARQYRRYKHREPLTLDGPEQ